MLALLQIFCRSVVILIFISSFARKVRHVAIFQQTITSFALLPARFSRAIALVVLLAEALVVVLAIPGGPLLLPGYLLAAMLLLLFSVALFSVLARGISTTCSCFGPGATTVSVIDIVRNLGFLACTLVGCFTLAEPAHPGALDLATWGLSGLCALIFVGVWTQLSEIIHLFS